LSEMGAQATSFCALDTLAVPYLDRIRSSRQQKFRRGQKNFQEASVVLLSHCFYCYFSAIADRLGSLPRHYTSWSGVRFLGSFGRRCGAATAKGPA
jgi:hypothetical protein